LTVCTRRGTNGIGECLLQIMRGRPCASTGFASVLPARPTLGTSPLQHRQRLTELLDAHGRPLHALLLRVTLRRDVAAELFQDLFARLAGSAGFAAADDPAAYAFRTAINLARDWRRGRGRHAAELLPPDLPAAGPSTGDASAVAAADHEELDRVLAAVLRLGQPARDAVCLRYLSQMSYGEVGRAVGRTAHQARAICHAAVVRVRNELAAETRVDDAQPSRR
jgi:RNA polymerase sigma factor (sigma-70 family)